MRHRLAATAMLQGSDAGIPQLLNEAADLLATLEAELRGSDRAALNWKIKAREWERDCWNSRMQNAATELVRTTNLVYEAEQEQGNGA